MTKLGPLHHVAIAVPRIANALPFYRDTLGLRAGEPRELAGERVRVIFLGDVPPLLELVEPLDDGSGVSRFVAERGRATLHHVCYVVDDLARALERLAAEGVQLIDRAPRSGAEGNVAFVHPRASGGVLIELIDRSSLRHSVP